MSAGSTGSAGLAPLALLAGLLARQTTQDEFVREALAAVTARDEPLLDALVTEFPWRARLLVHELSWAALRDGGPGPLASAARIAGAHDAAGPGTLAPEPEHHGAPLTRFVTAVQDLRLRGRDSQRFDQAFFAGSEALARGDSAAARAGARTAVEQALDLQLPYLELRARRLLAESQRQEPAFRDELLRTVALERELGLWTEAGADLEALARVEFERGRLEAALAHAQEAESLAVLRGEEPRALALVVLRGELLVHLGRLEDAERLLRAALPRAERAGARALGEVATLLGELAAGRGHYAEALGRFGEAARRLAEDEPRGALRAEIRLAGACSELGRWADAEDALTRAGALLERHALGPERGPWWLAWGLVHLDAGRAQEALAALARVEETAPGLPALRAEALRLSGAAWLLLDRPAEAERAFRRSLAAWNADPLKNAWTRTGLGDALLALGKPAAARTAFEDAIAEAEWVPTLEGTWRAWFGLGRCAEQEGALEPASAAYARAIADVEALRGELAAPALRARWLGSKHELYRRAVALLVRRGRIDEAFRLAQAAQARTLLELAGPASSAPGDPADEDATAPELARLTESEARLRLLDRRLAELPPTPEAEATRAELQQHLEVTRAAFESARLELERREPRRARLQGLGDGPGLGEIRALLGTSERLLQYVVGASETIVFVVGRQDASCQRLAVTEAELESLVARVLDPIARLARGRLDLATLGFDARAARELYRILVEPLAGELTGCDTLWLVRDGPLRRLPFGLLVVRREKLAVDPARLFAQYGGCRFLVEERACAELPIAGLLAQSPRAGPPSPALVAADPSPRPRGAVALPAAAREARQVAEANAPARLLLGEEASESRLKALLPAAGLVHLATHGWLDDRRPAFSRLAFAPGAGEDGWLHAFEIERLPLVAERVVLSACETVGDERRGEGLLGLARAFLAAGARSVVASGWAVDDQASAELMRRYGAALAGGVDAVAALRTAQVALLRGPGRPGVLYLHPYFWGGFRHIGPR